MDNVNRNTDSINKLKESTRLDWIDILRALAMVIVVLVHAASGLEGWWIYTVFTGPIMIPLFFAISGYLFNDRNGETKTFLIHLLNKIVVPWLFLSLIWARAMLIPFKGVDYWFEHLYKMISGQALWFLPACIIAEILFFYILKFCKSKSQICVGVFICVLSGFLMDYFNIGGFAMFNRALIAQAFLLCGYLFRIYQKELLNLKWRYIISGIICYVIMGSASVLLLPGQHMDVHKNMYQNIILCFLMIFLGCFLLFILASKIKMAPKLLTFIGKNTLVCYAFHLYGFTIVDKVFSVIELDFAQGWMGAILKTIFAMMICAIAALILNRFLPELVGKKRLKYKF